MDKKKKIPKKLCVGHAMIVVSMLFSRGQSTRYVPLGDLFESSARATMRRWRKRQKRNEQVTKAAAGQYRLSKPTPKRDVGTMNDVRE